MNEKIDQFWLFIWKWNKIYKSIYINGHLSIMFDPKTFKKLFCCDKKKCVNYCHDSLDTGLPLTTYKQYIIHIEWWKNEFGNIFFLYLLWNKQYGHTHTHTYANNHLSVYRTIYHHHHHVSKKTMKNFTSRIGDNH